MSDEFPSIKVVDKVEEIMAESTNMLDASESPIRLRTLSTCSDLQLDTMIDTPKTKENVQPLAREEASDREYTHPEHYPGPDEYPRVNQDDLGVVLIFNFDTFRVLEKRNGSRLDVRALVETLTRLKFSIHVARCYNNLTRKELINAINLVVEEIESSTNIIMAFFLSHGKENNNIATYDSEVSVEEIVELFNRKHLEDVPKWLTFATCKGDVNRPKQGTKIISPTLYTNRLPENFVIFFATTEGNFAVRVEEEGTWVVQELCANMCAYGERQDVISILTRTNKCVANNYVAEDLKDMRIVPTIVSTLTKKLFLTASKDRRSVLEIHKLLTQIKELMNC